MESGTLRFSSQACARKSSGRWRREPNAHSADFRRLRFFGRRFSPTSAVFCFAPSIRSDRNARHASIPRAMCGDAARQQRACAGLGDVRSEALASAA